MKTICFISLNGVVPFGGCEDLWYETALNLKSKNHNVCAIVFDWKTKENPKITNIGKHGIKLVRIPFGNNIILKLRRLLTPLFGDLLIKKVDYHLNRNQPDIVILTTTAPTGSELLAGVMRQNIPYILNVQLADELIWHATDQSVVSCYSGAKAVYFLCERNRTATEKQLGTYLLNAKRHYNPIKTSSDRFEYKEGDEVIHFACVARMGVEHKRQDLILDVLNTPTWKSRNWRLHFYGDGEHRDSIKRLVEMYGLGERVFFHGHVSNINEIWRDCHALLLPSTYEGAPMAVVEAMKCGRVPIVTNVGFAADFMEDGRNGFKSESATYSDYGNAMERAWQKRDSWSQIGSNAKATISEVYPKDPAEYFATEILNAL